jgi:hypothetical protein
MDQIQLRVLHVYEHSPEKFAELLNEALRRVAAAGGVVDDILYSVDASTASNRRGGFGAVVVYVLEPGHELPAEEARALFETGADAR